LAMIPGYVEKDPWSNIETTKHTKGRSASTTLVSPTTLNKNKLNKLLLQCIGEKLNLKFVAPILV
jgi:hypothetical protein